MKLHSVVVSYERLELLKRTIESYLETVTLPFSLHIVDNGSSQEVVDYISEVGHPYTLLGENRYPGYATNTGFAQCPPDATHLHRSDSDMHYLPGWCSEVETRFDQDRNLGQLGLRTDEEEHHAVRNVGGTAVFRRQLWLEGLRYREEPWSELGDFQEAYWITREVVKMGWNWQRVRRPCVIHTASGDMNDPYYQQSYGIRGIKA